MADYVRQTQDKVEQYASRLEQGGYSTIVDDVQRFARRRPGLFLLSAAAAGFAVGRLVRGAQAAPDSSAEPDSLPAPGQVALPPAAGGMGPAPMSAVPMTAPGLHSPVP